MNDHEDFPPAKSDSGNTLGGELIWRPTAAWIERSNLRRFTDRHGIVSLDELQRRSKAGEAADSRLADARLCDLRDEALRNHISAERIRVTGAIENQCAAGIGTFTALQASRFARSFL